MATGQVTFTRIVLGLHRGAGSETLRLAAAIAGELHLDLIGMFFADARLAGLGGLPFAREFRPFGGGWQPIDRARLAREMELASRATERLFAAAVRGLPTACRFEVVTGATVESFGVTSQAGDILMIEEPESAADRATAQFADLVEAALRSAASVMLLPRRVARVSGAIVAIAARPDDPSVRVARSIAAAIREELVVVPRYEALRTLRERMIVLTRDAAAKTLPSLLAASRRVPVLIVEPDMEPARSPNNEQTKG